MNNIINCKTLLDTQKLASCLSKHIKPSYIICLEGQLGAGKSEFSRSIIKSIGIKENITSPTFNIMNIYTNNNLIVRHYDWYRLTNLDELYYIGIEDYLNDNSISIIEWPNIFEKFAKSLKCIYIKISINEDQSRNFLFSFINGQNNFFGELKNEFNSF